VRQPVPGAVSRSVASLVLAVSLVYAAEPAPATLRTGPLLPTVVAVTAAVTAFGITYVRTVWSSVVGGPGRDRRPVDLAIGASAAFALAFAYGPGWLALPGLLAGAAVIALTPRRSAPVVVLILAGQALVAVVWRVRAAELADLLVQSVITIVVLGALGWLTSLYDELSRSRVELARMAVVEERLRFSRDLHDVLGHTLSVIGLKNEVALLLIERDPGKAAQEIRDSLDVSRRAAGDLRALVRGYRNQSLTAEIAGVRSILELAGVGCEADAVPPQLPQPVQDAVGWLVREGGTNVLRHSKATRCEIRLRVSDRQLVVEMSNDNPDGAVTDRPPATTGGAGAGGGRAGGAGGGRADGAAGGRADGAADRAGGHGLVGLRERFAAITGQVTWSVADGRFVLRAEVPLGAAVGPA
jgi:two-component system sensor histidine kinase DesK